MSSIFDNKEPSELSRTIMDGEGAIEPMSKATRWGIVIGLYALLFVSAFFVGQYVHSGTEDLGDVKEVDGVLYYPDGQPVRNYEQLNVYLNSHGE